MPVAFLNLRNCSLRYNELNFPCDERHDELVRIILPYSRNVSQVEDSLEADSMRGQMTTETLGFSQT